MTEFFAVLFAILCVDVAYRICAASARDWEAQQKLLPPALRRDAALAESAGALPRWGL